MRKNSKYDGIDGLQIKRIIPEKGTDDSKKFFDEEEIFMQLDRHPDEKKKSNMD